MKHLQDYLLFMLCLLGGFSALTSCTNKDLFDQDAWNEEMKETFPVTEIADGQNWKTAGTATANITVNKDAGSTYTVKVYDADPINDTAILLAKGTVTSGSTFTTKFDYALADSTLFVACVDSHNRRELIPVHNVTDGSSFSVTFGTPTTTASANQVISRSATSRASVIIKQTACPYNADQITAYMNGTSAHRVTNGENVAYWETRDKGYQNFYIDSNITSLTGLASGDFTAKRLIIAKGGTFSLSSNITVRTGVEIIVADGGKLELNGYTLNPLTSGYALVVMPGAQVTGTGNAYIYANGGGSMYNNGTMNVPVLYWSTGGTIYNGPQGSMTVSTVFMKQGIYNAYFVNYSPNCHIGDMTSQVDNYNIMTSCKMIVDKWVEAKGITVADGASLQCGSLLLHNCDVSLGNASILKASKSYYSNFDMSGPTSGDPAIYEAGDIYCKNWGLCRFFDLLYTDVTSYSANYFSKAWYNTCIWYYYGASEVGPGEADETIPAGDCTVGYTSVYGPEPDDNDFNMTYCFEDNYPKAGDYDFNDAVFDITRTLNGNVVNLAVKLRAVGASKKLGAAIRLSGITSGITSVALDNGFGNASTGYQEGLNNSGIVIPIFSDAHQVLTGSTNRVFINTKKSGSDAVTANAKTLNITITCASADVAAGINVNTIDPYITNEYFEIHTYAWRDKAALGKIAENLEAGKFVWAIAVPNSFKYPLEYQVITGAYSKFASWAKTQNNSAWYKTYDSSLLY